MKLLFLVERMFAWIQFRLLEIELDGRNKAIDSTCDMSLYFELVKSREDTKRRLVAARADYTATFRPGVRFTWKNA